VDDERVAEAFDEFAHCVVRALYCDNSLPHVRALNPFHAVTQAVQALAKVRP
jgi:hypothetical protein